MKFLLRCGADAERMITRGETPLLLAAWLGYADVVEQLLDHGADPERVMPSGKAKGKTALQVAIIKGHGDVVDLLKKEEPSSPSVSHNMEDSEEEDKPDDEDLDETWKPSKGFDMNAVEDDSEDDVAVDRNYDFDDWRNNPYGPRKKKPASRKPATKKRPASPPADDGEPKTRKQSGWIFYNAQKRDAAKAEVEAENPDMTCAREKQHAIMKKLGDMWGKLDDAAKQKWKDDAPIVAVKPPKAKKAKKEKEEETEETSNLVRRLAYALTGSGKSTLIMRCAGEEDPLWDGSRPISVAHLPEVACCYPAGTHKKKTGNTMFGRAVPKKGVYTFPKIIYDESLKRGQRYEKTGEYVHYRKVKESDVAAIKKAFPDLDF